MQTAYNIRQLIRIGIVSTIASTALVTARPVQGNSNDPKAAMATDTTSGTITPSFNSAPAVVAQTKTLIEHYWPMFDGDSKRFVGPVGEVLLSCSSLNDGSGQYHVSVGRSDI